MKFSLPLSFQTNELPAIQTGPSGLPEAVWEVMNLHPGESTFRPTVLQLEVLSADAAETEHKAVFLPLVVSLLAALSVLCGSFLCRLRVVLHEADV